MFALTPNKKLVNQNTKVQLVHQVLHVWLPHRLYTRFFCLDLQVSIIDLAKIIVWQGGGNGNGAAGWGIGCAWCPHSYWLNSTWSESAPLVMKIISMTFERNWKSSRCPTGSSKFETPCWRKAAIHIVLEMMAVFPAFMCILLCTLEFSSLHIKNKNDNTKQLFGLTF